MSYDWLISDADGSSVDELRVQVERDNASVLIFLGAGLSFGVGRFLGRASFERPSPWDDERFPSWPDLIERMKQNLLAEAEGEIVQRSYERFFGNNDYLDCAQLYRTSIGDERYFEFLRAQFETRQGDAERLTPSHVELVRLPISELFTTNYDELIELSFENGSVSLEVSVTSEEFLSRKPTRPERHLIKLHGTISRPDTIVLTRDDYAGSRRTRTEMFDHLAHEVRYVSFLFVGFSLADPNFNLIRDDARVAMGDNMPASYLVQERPDAIVRRYLDSLDVRTIGLESWNAMPALIRAINPSDPS